MDYRGADATTTTSTTAALAHGATAGGESRRRTVGGEGPSRVACTRRRRTPTTLLRCTYSFSRRRIIINNSASRPASQNSPARLPAARRSSSDIHTKRDMGRDEAVVTQKSEKPPSPPKDHPAPYPCLDWSTVQAYYGPGFVPPIYFGPGIPPGHAPPPFMWGPQPPPPSALGKPYTAMYSHGGGFSHPFLPLMVNPLSAEPAKSVNSNANSLNVIVKDVGWTAMSTGSTDSEKTSGDCSLGGSSDGNNQKATGTPKKRRVDTRPISGIKTCQSSAANGMPGEPGILATLPNLRIPDRAIKLNASSASDFGVIDTPISAESPDQDGRESKRERRKQSNRDSARRSRLRKQAETDELARRVELLTVENRCLRREINRLRESSKKLSSENSALMMKLTDAAPDRGQEASADQTTEQPARAVKNFMAMIDGTTASRGGGSPKLRQLLGSGLAADAVAAR